MEEVIKKKRGYPLSKAEMIEKSRLIHGEVFDLSEIPDYIFKSIDKVVLTCNICGSRKEYTWQTHSDGSGCWACSRKKIGASVKLTDEEIIKRIETSLPGVFSFGNFKRHGKDVTITCKEHGVVTLPFNSLTHGSNGCPGCDKRHSHEPRPSRIKHGLEKELIEEGYEIITGFSDFRTMMTISCPKHGEFSKWPSDLKDGKRCQKCSKENSLEESLPFRFEKFMSDSLVSMDSNLSLINPGYDYKHQRSRIVTKCKECGLIWKPQAGNLLSGQGCPNCSNSSKDSKGEKELFDFLSAHFPDSVPNDREVLKGKELDVYIPSKKFAVEYNGLYYHSESMGKNSKYHLTKMIECEKEGIQLVHIFEDEWEANKEVVKKSLLSKLGVSEEKVFYARKLVIKEISLKEAVSLLNENHIQGACPAASRVYGLFNKEDLVSVMCFLDYKEESELVRFCSSARVIGGFSRLLTFSRKYNCNPIFSFSDNRWSTGTVYKRNGFILCNESNPSYFWCKGQRREHRRNFQHQYLFKKLNGEYDSSKTEEENCLAAGYFKVWDCGKKKWRLKV